MDLVGKWKIASAVAASKLFGRPAPLHASWVATSRCNLRCVYCTRNEALPKELNTDEAYRMVDLLAKAGCVRLSVTGGEPLLREDLPLVLARARHHGISISINTNGLLVAKKLDVARLADRIVISLDGPPEVHDELRGRGSYAGAMSGAEAARNAGIPVSYYTVIGKSNAGRLDELVRVAESAGETIFFQPGSSVLLGAEACENAEAPRVEDYRAAIDRLIEWKRRGRPVGNSVAALAYLRHWPDPKPIACQGGRLFVRIDSDGHVRACGRMPRGPDNFLLTKGVQDAMKTVDVRECSACYSAARAEVNLMAQGSADALWNIYRKS